MKILELMVPRVFACRQEDSLAEAAKLMWDHDIGCAPVVDAEERVVGMITDRDICMAAYLRGTPLWAIGVASTMSREVLACRPDQNVADVETVMRRGQLRRTPVVDEDGKLVGIVSLNDLAREAMRQRSSKQREVVSADIAATLAAVGEPRHAADGLELH